MGPKPARKRLRGTGAAAVRLSIAGQILGSTAIAELLKLARIQMITERAGDIAKTGLATKRRSRIPIWADLVWASTPTFFDQVA